MANQQIVLAFFDDEAAADDAVESLKDWDKANKDVKLTSIGVLVLDDKGQLKTRKMGSRSANEGRGHRARGRSRSPAVPPRRHRRWWAAGRAPPQGLGLSIDEPTASRLGSPAARPPEATARAATWPRSAPSWPRSVGSPRSTRPAEEAVAEVETDGPEVEAAEAAAGDDLTVIDGIGPDYANSLRAAGVTTFAQLAEMTPEAIADLLAKANTPLIAGHDVSTWPRQAKLAAAGYWSGLRRYINSKK